MGRQVSTQPPHSIASLASCKDVLVGVTGCLQWQFVFCQKFLKAGIAPQRVESWFDRENHHRPIPFLISLLQIVEGRVFLVESKVNDSKVVSGDEIVLRFLLQTLE